MNVQTAIPARIDGETVWLDFVSPTTGKQASINVATLIERQSGIGADAMREWMEAQRRIYAVQNPDTKNEGSIERGK